MKHEYMQLNTAAARNIYLEMEGKLRKLSSRIGSALKGITHFTKQSTRPVLQLWRSLLLARAFYPALSPSEISTLESATLEPTDAVSPHDDLFDPILVRSVSRSIHSLIRFRVAIRVGASKEARMNALLCRQYGWSEYQVGAATSGYDEAAFSERERLVLRYTDDLTRTPLDLDLATMRQLKIHFDDCQLNELTAAITQENFKVRFRTAFEMTQSNHGATRN